MTKPELELVNNNLHAAAALLAAVHDKLDQTSHSCEACGLTVKHNYPHARIAEQLEGMQNKIKGFIKQLQTTTET